MEHFGVEENSRELQVLVYSFADGFAGGVEVAADQIYNSSHSGEIRENAVLWKMNAIPVMYKAAFMEDPMGALLNCWTFCIQMRVYFESGAGQETFGEYQSIAVDASKRLEKQATELAERIITTQDVDIRESMVAYATSNPIENQLFVRPPGGERFLKATAGGEAVGGLAAAASMNEGMRQLSDRMGIFTVSVPKQVQWQTELIMARTPMIVAEQRDSLIAGFDEGSVSMASFIEKERAIMMAFISAERSAALIQLVETRSILLKTLADERTLVLQAITDERNETMEQLNVMTLGSIESMLSESGELTTSTIDHLFLRTTQLLSLIFVGILVLCAVIFVMIRKSRVPVAA